MQGFKTSRLMQSPPGKLTRSERAEAESQIATSKGVRFFTAASNIKVLHAESKSCCCSLLVVGYPACRFKWHRRAHNLNVNYAKVLSLSLSAAKKFFPLSERERERRRDDQVALKFAFYGRGKKVGRPTH
jgi:hypothetical protein